MGFFKKLWNVHDKLVHPIETSLKKKGGSNTFGGLLKGAGITPKDAPETVPGSTFQQRPGYNATTHMYEQQPGAPMGQTITNGGGNGGRTYTPNPFAAQQAQVGAIRSPGGAAGAGQMAGMAANPMSSFGGGQPPPQQPQQAPQQQGQGGQMMWNLPPDQLTAMQQRPMMF